VNQLVDELAVAVVTISHVVACHVDDPLELEAAFARGIGQRLDPAMIDIGAAVEDDIRDAGRLDRAFGNQLADSAAASQSAPVLMPLRRSASSVDAAARVAPFSSSMTWA
jgi:hypothetical protein